MKQIPATRSVSPPGTPLLYRFVFERTLVRFFVVVLLASFFLQTVERAFAAEVPEEPPPNLPVTITDETVATIQSEMTERSEEPAVVVEAEPTPPPGEVVVAPEPTESVEPVAEPPLPVPDDTSAVSETTEAVTTDTPVTTPTDDEASSEATEATSSVTSSVATTTDITTPTLTVESDQMIQFNKSNCLAVEDGSYYCQIATTTIPTDDHGLFALPDEDGDLEIYIKNNDGLKQITFNNVDDASPQYDPASDSLVWHRLVNERYQIVVYDLASGEEKQLTDTSTNNMEPFRADNHIVWQYWDNDAWQIMFYDGTTATQLTNTSEHNLAPVIRNNLVVWHRVLYEEKTIEVYDISSRAFMTIRDDNGGTISNPRMVLVYDASMENGDVVTKGYDLITGEITSFAAEPAPLPEEIPDPDNTGETRALLSSKTSSEDESLDDATPADPHATSTPPELDLTIGTTTIATATSSDLTLDLTALEPVVVDEPAPAVAVPDLVVAPYSEPASPTVIPVVE